MGGTKRQFNNLYSKFSQKFKKPLADVLRICPIGFTDIEYIQEFKAIYPYLWNELQDEYQFWKAKNDVILKYGKKSRYNFPRPDNFILIKSVHLRQKVRANNTMESANDEDRGQLRDELINLGKAKLDRQTSKHEKKLELTQILAPDFLKNMMDTYHNLKGIPQEIINRKLEIIREAGNYKSRESIAFLQKLNAKEQNFELKQATMLMLQNMNEKIILRRKRKGKKSSYIETVPLISDSPDSLFEKLQDQMTHYEFSKNFDVFISHNSLDRESIIGFYKGLNLLGLHIYIDWVNDKYPLKRDLTNENTAKAILQRLTNSKVLVCFITKASATSQWMPWEIGYFHGIGKPVLVYNPQNISLPAFLKLYPILINVNDELSIKADQETIRLDTWILKNCPNSL